MKETGISFQGNNLGRLKKDAENVPFRVASQDKHSALCLSRNLDVLVMKLSL